MTQTQTNEGIFDGLSGKETAEKILQDGGQEGLAFATMVIALRAMKATEDDDLRCDIAKNLFSLLKASAIESFLGAMIKRCAKDDEFREPIEDSPLLCMAIMGKTCWEEKKTFAGILNNLCTAALEEEKKKTS
jgi:hypothetical protein